MNLCQLDELGLSCFGCCGHDYGTRQEIVEAIKKNTLELKDYGARLKDFMDRSQSVRECGICRNVVFLDKDKVGCPLHPHHQKIKKVKDLRKNHCDTKYLCKTYKLYKTWSKEKKKEFIRFLKKLIIIENLGWYSYSKGMDDDSLLERFLKK